VRREEWVLSKPKPCELLLTFEPVRERLSYCKKFYALHHHSLKKGGNFSKHSIWKGRQDKARGEIEGDAKK
jgi:hypothetical protein